MKIIPITCVLIALIFMLSNCTPASIIEQGDDVEIIPVSFESDGWKSEQIHVQRIDGQEAVIARKYENNKLQITVEIVDSSIVPGAENAFPIDSLEKAFDVDFQGETAKLNPVADNSTFVIIQHRSDKKIVRAIGYGFKAHETFLEATKIIEL